MWFYRNREALGSIPQMNYMRSTVAYNRFVSSPLTGVAANITANTTTGSATANTANQTITGVAATVTANAVIV